MARILVIEDNAANRKLTLLLLHHAGHETVAADDAASGIEAAQTRQPDLILMDIQLPDIDGLAATRELKADPRTAHIPIVALTAFAMKGDEKRMLAAGCIAYISKPIHYQEFLATIAANLNTGGPKR